MYSKYRLGLLRIVYFGCSKYPLIVNSKMMLKIIKMSDLFLQKYNYIDVIV